MLHVKLHANRNCTLKAVKIVLVSVIEQHAFRISALLKESLISRLHTDAVSVPALFLIQSEGEFREATLAITQSGCSSVGECESRPVCMWFQKLLWKNAVLSEAARESPPHLNRPPPPHAPLLLYLSTTRCKTAVVHYIKKNKQKLEVM